MSETARIERLRAELREREIDRLLVGPGTNLRYLTAFTGSSGVALLDASDRAEHRFFTDFRYDTQSARQVADVFEREIVAGGDLLEAVAQALNGQDGSGGRLGFDDAALSVKEHTRLLELLDGGWQLIAGGGLVERLREVKEDGEIAAIQAAAELADQALVGVIERGLVGRSEREVAIELELTMRRLGAQGASFPTIVACGAHGALPHAEPREQPIARDTLVTIDWGAYLDGYCSDCTRTYATGRLDAQAAEVYSLVLEAQRAVVGALRAGRSGREVDAVARRPIEQAGHGEHFGHGLGHGVGMEVHEAPRLSRTASEDPLRPGNVVTVEPGVYLPERLGVRIEDLVVVEEHGCRSLTTLPRELQTVS
ncbi:MAG TPA: Xaa-Pro peptidase family protein [Solirubrobacteraceae bacterium]|nr:Xaa-Pro peptidase family protein [Solirubrobacteraceae bacterium]